MNNRYVWRILTLCALSFFGSTAAANLLSNPGFETFETTFVPNVNDFLPSSTGDWSGDESMIVTGTQLGTGVSPLTGSNMLQFFYTTFDGPSAQFGGSEVFQLVDVTGYSSAISNGNALASASFFANRVAGDAETDSEFDVDIAAFNGVPSDFSIQSWTNPLARETGLLISDGNIATWEEVTTQLLLPAGTTYIAIRIAAIENVFNDAVAEFDGHYADDAYFSITTVPIPGGLLLFSSGLLGLIGILRRKKEA
jgi:hypothetical protein